VLIAAEYRSIEVRNSTKMSAQSTTTENLLLESNVKFESLLQNWKHKLEFVPTDEGMPIDCGDRQYPKAHSPKIAILEPGANVKLKSSSQQLTQASEIV
jgi:hypothetical protein